MKNPTHALSRLSLTGMLAILSLAQPAFASVVGPYTPDAATVYLFHLDEVAGSTTAANAPGTLAVGTNAIAYQQNVQTPLNAPLDFTILGATGASGFAFGDFGLAAVMTNVFGLNSVISNGLGVDMNLNGSFQLNNGGGSGDTVPNHVSILGTYNAFTVEALINLPHTNAGLNREIVCLDSGEGARSFQFRITGTRLEFNSQPGVNAAANDILVAIPNSGTHGFVSNAWFHVALTHIELPTGTNTIFYWTRLSDSVTSANAILTNTTATVNNAAPLIIAIGNEARATGGSAEGLLGMIDEVRISRAVRAPVNMMFTDATANTIFQQPVSTTVASGQPASFSVVGSGQPPLSFQWYTTGTGGDVAIANATNSTLNIAAAAVTDATNYFAVVSNMSAASVTSSVVSLTVRVAVDSLAWRGTNANWNFVTANFSNTVSAASGVVFQQGDNVLFDDGATNLTVNLGGTLMPGSITVNSASNYTFASIGNLAGPASITKSGNGMLTLNNPIAQLNNPNTFTGTVTVNSGILRTAGGSALGATSGATTVNGGTFDVNGQNLGFEPFVVQGDGVNGTNGALNNAGGQQQAAIRNVTLSGNATFNASNNRWDIHNTGGLGGQFVGNGFKLTKRGGSDVWIKDVGDTGLGDIDVRQGTLGFQGTPMGLGNAASNMTVFPGATFGIFAVADLLNKNLVLTNGAMFSGGAGINTFIGPVTLQGTNTIVTDSILHLAGPVSGTGGFNKNNASILSLEGTNTYSGSTFVNAGTLALGFNSTLGSSVLVRLASGTVLDASLPGGIEISSGRTLAGSGTILGNVTNTAGSTLSPGLSAGTLTIGGELSLGNSTNIVELSGDPLTIGGGINDLTAVSTLLNLSGVNTIKIVPIAPLSAANPYTIITYGTGLNGGAANLFVTSDNPRYTFNVVDPTTTFGLIQIAVIGNPTPLIWKGGKLPNVTAWNHTVTNWFNPAITNFDRFYDGDIVTFDDTAVTNLVTLTETNAAGLALFNNNTLNYVLNGSGAIGGLMAKEGTNSVTFSITNAAALGMSAITNNAGTLNFNLPLDVTLSAPISDNNFIGGTIRKEGTNNLTVSGDNLLFNGPFVVAAGTLTVTANNALGSSAAGTVVSNGARLFLSGNRTVTESATLNGAYDGVGGALQSGGGGTANLDGQITLGSNTRVSADAGSTLNLRGGFLAGSGNLTVGGAGNSGIALAAIDGLGTNSITKVDAGQLNIAVDSAAYDGNIFVNGGILRVSALSFGLGSTVGATIIATNTTLDFFFNSPSVSDAITITGTGTANQGAIHTGGGGTCNPIMYGPITLANNAQIKMDGATTLVISNTISGAGDLLVTIDGNGPMTVHSNVVLGTHSVTKNSSGTLALNGTGNAWSGPTIIVSGTILLGPGASLGTSSLIAVGTNGPAILDATAPGLSLANQTLAGLGTVRGDTTFGSGAVMSAGFNSVGILGFNTNTITFTAGSSNIVEFIKTGTVTCDQVLNIGTVNIGGTLVVNNVGVNPLASGDALKLYGATNYTGGFAAIYPSTPGTGLVWNTSTLTTDGTLRVAAAAAPQINNVTLINGTNFTFAVTGGTANGTYSVLSHTNLLSPLSTWSTIGSGTFDGSGNTLFTNSVVAGTPVRFYLIQTP